MKKDHPPIIVISGAMGSGKGTVMYALSREFNVRWIPTHTTRAIRPDDDILSNRIYDTEATFSRHEDRGEFIESTKIAGHSYGLLREDLEKELRHHHSAIIELSVEGGIAVAKAYPDTFLLYLATDEKIRRNRITRRGMDRKVIDERIKADKQSEKLARKSYHYVIENPADEPHHAIDTIKKLIMKRFSEIHETAT